MGRNRQREHALLLEWMVGQVQQHAVDAVIIAGDVFDTASPPSYARELYHQLIARMHACGTSLLILGGNHDAVSVLGESVPLLHHLSTRVIASTHTENADQHVVVLPLKKDEHNGAMPGCIVCALPFIRARDVLHSLPDQSAQDKQLSLLTAIRTTYAQVYAAALQQQAALQTTHGVHVPIIATGHLTTVGTSRSESVREIYVGALEAFPTNAFPPVDYIALGHIHQPQKVGGLEHIRYSGSPIALSFDEAHQHKQMLLVDIGSDGLQKVTPLPIPVFQPMHSLQSDLKGLPAALEAAAAKGTADCPVWVEVTVVHDDYLNDLSARVQAITQDLPVQVLRIRRQRGDTKAAFSSASGESLQELSPDEVFARRLQQEQLDAPVHLALQQRHAQVLAALQNGEETQA